MLPSIHTHNRMKSFFFCKSMRGHQNPVEVKSLSRARHFATPWIVACTKLLCPWDFQGKRPWDFQGQSPWDFQGKSTGVGCHFLLQGIFPTQGSNPGLSHCRQTLYSRSHPVGPLQIIPGKLLSLSQQVYFQSSPLLSVTVLLNFPPVNNKGLLLIQIHFSYCPSNPHPLSSFTISLLDIQGLPTIGPKTVSHVSGFFYGSIPLPGNKFSFSYLHHRLLHQWL